MRHRLWFKLFAGYLISVLFMFVLLNTYGINRVEGKLFRERKILLYNEASSLSSKYMNSYYNRETSLEELTFQMELIDKLINTRIWVVNSQGYIISDTRADESNNKSININELDSNFLASTFSENTIMPGVLSEPALSVIMPVVNNFQVRGYIVLHTALSVITADTIYFIDTFNIVLLAFSIILGIFLIYLYFITVLPLRKLMHAASEYASANYSYKIDLKRQDEFQDLANSLTYMSEEIRSFDDYQKKFIANISHDFRSPLTSIKGYAEALQDGTIPYEMKDKYLDIILFETNRLNKLTTSLLELNNFDYRYTMLDIATFDINHTIKTTAESFEGTCTAKKITLKLSFSSKEIYVDADNSKIQQVLYNLIDNAIKFSPPKSDIHITTMEKGDKVFVTVKDHGVGIPKEGIKKIWDRFYKTDASRGKDKTGTGLGLSIAKEIITAHGENINVISTQGVGTEFLFTLPRTEGFL